MTTQKTTEGQRIVTVARDGSRMANCGAFSKPIYVTAIYAAKTRRDGVVTWRREDSVGRGTSGSGISQPMIAHACHVAGELGLEYAAGIRHGKVCP